MRRQRYLDNLRREKTLSRLKSEIEKTNELLVSLSTFEEFNYVMAVILFIASIIASMLYSSKVNTDVLDLISNFFVVLILLFVLIALFIETVGAFWIVSKNNLNNENLRIDPKLLHTKRYLTTALKFSIITTIIAFSLGVFIPNVLPYKNLSGTYFIIFVVIAFTLIMLIPLFIGIGLLFDLNISIEYFLPKSGETRTVSNKDRGKKKQFLEIWYIINIITVSYFGAPVIREISNIIISTPTIGVFILALIVIYLYASFAYTTELIKDALGRYSLALQNLILHITHNNTDTKTLVYINHRLKEAQRIRQVRIKDYIFIRFVEFNGPEYIEPISYIQLVSGLCFLWINSWVMFSGIPEPSISTVIQPIKHHWALFSMELITLVVLQYLKTRLVKM